jgi:hypothetical protein
LSLNLNYRSVVEMKEVEDFQHLFRWETRVEDKGSQESPEEESQKESQKESREEETQK